MENISVNYVWTEDDLRLQGICYEPAEKNLAVLFIHGMGGNFVENTYADVLGRTLQKVGIGFIYAHNRGYGHINDIATKERSKDGGYKYKRYGAAYERFEESKYDLRAWVNECERLGYKQVVLMGHSLGCNKIVYYIHEVVSEGINGVILASPPDMIELARDDTKYQGDLAKARENVRKGEPRKILEELIWDWYMLSSQTFLDLSEENALVDNIPVSKKSGSFDQLKSINVPILGIAGENDDIAKTDLNEYLNVIGEEATGCPSFSQEIITGANHSYENKENELAEVVVKWVKELSNRD